MTTTTSLPCAPAAGSVLADDEVVRRVLAGETGLFEVLMRRYNRRLYRVARGILRDDAEAEDVMQHAYVAAYMHLRQYQGRALFSTWLTRIAVYEALARLRRRGREVTSRPWSETDPGSEQALRSAGPDPEQQVLQDEMRLLLESAIDALPVGYRAVFVLRELEGLTTVETAESLAVSADVVKTRLHRARLLLREALFATAGPVPAAYPFLEPRCDRVVRAVLSRLNPQLN